MTEAEGMGGGGSWWYGDGSSMYLVRGDLFFRGDGQQQVIHLQHPVQHWIPQQIQLITQARIAMIMTDPTMIPTITGHLCTLAQFQQYSTARNPE